MTASSPVLARVVRSGFVESVHRGRAVVVGPDGAVIRAIGDVGAAVSPRSSNKPFQAAAGVAAGSPLTGALLALSAASHSGEPFHVSGVLDILAGAGLTERDLGCPPDLPLDPASRTAAIVADEGPARRYMNCSGKHAGMLAACVAAGWDPATYLDPGHPLQLAIAARVTELAGEAPAWTAVDGCGAPLYMLSLAGLARAFGRVSAAPAETPEGRVAAAMRAHPAMVAGTGRDDTLLMEGIPGLLAKGGAEGVHCAALADGTAVAVKIDDGAERPRMPVLTALLRSVGVQGAVLDQLGTGTVLGGGRPVGTVELEPGALPD